MKNSSPMLLQRKVKPGQLAEKPVPAGIHMMQRAERQAWRNDAKAAMTTSPNGTVSSAGRKESASRKT